MDVFGIATAPAGQGLRDAAIAAGHELGVFAAVAAGPRALDELAAAVGAPRGPRLRALIDVLVALGALARDGERIAAGAPAPRPAVVRAGWGLLAGVIRADRPLPPEDGELARRYHHHLLAAGAAPAAELAAWLGDRGRVLDLGGGAGAYTEAVLARDPRARATLVDAAEVVALARAHLARFGDRVAFVAGDARAVALEPHGVALLANVLHLHPPAACAELCAAAARAVAPGGLVVVKDLRVDEDRRGPLEGLMFALNMAVYTDGDVYPTSALRGWLAAAGLDELEERRLASAPEAVVVVGRRGTCTGAAT